MSKKLLILSVVTCLFFSDYTQAAPGDVEDVAFDGGNPEPEPDAAPINGKAVLLAVAGILFAGYTFRKVGKEETQG